MLGSPGDGGQLGATQSPAGDKAALGGTGDPLAGATPECRPGAGGSVLVS